MMKRFLLSLSLLTVVAVAMAGNTQPRHKKVYMFGVGQSFTDSLAYVTEVQEIEAYIMPNGFLSERSLYTLQLNNYLVAKRDREHMTCAVFFNTSKSKADKKLDKIRKKYRKGFLGTRLIELRIDEFQFKPEEWVAPYDNSGEEKPKEEKPKKKKK